MTSLPTQISPAELLIWLVVSGFGGMVLGWVWKASKEHTTMTLMVEDVAAMKLKHVNFATVDMIKEIKDGQKIFLTVDHHNSLQTICQQQIRKEFDDKHHELYNQTMEKIDVTNQQLSNLNANVCKIMGYMQIEPVQDGKKRRGSDYQGNAL